MQARRERALAKAEELREKIAINNLHPSSSEVKIDVQVVKGYLTKVYMWRTLRTTDTGGRGGRAPLI